MGGLEAAEALLITRVVSRAMRAAAVMLGLAAAVASFRARLGDDRIDYGRGYDAMAGVF